MPFSFNFAPNTVVYLDKNGQYPATLEDFTQATVDAVEDEQGLAEVLIGTSPDNFALNKSNLLYQTQTDHNITFGAGAVPVDGGSASPSASGSASPSAS